MSKKIKYLVAPNPLDKNLTIDKLYKTITMFSESFNNGEIIC